MEIFGRGFNFASVVLGLRLGQSSALSLHRALPELRLGVSNRPIVLYLCSGDLVVCTLLLWP